MGIGRRLVVLLVAGTAAVVVPLAATRYTETGSGQIIPPGPGQGPVTTPQPTVPCTTIQGTCGPTGGDALHPWAYVYRYCNGDAVPTPPGHTTYELVYGIGGNTDPALFPGGSGTFSGTLFQNGVEIPSNPLATLPIGGRDQRIREGVVASDTTFMLQMTVVNSNGTQIPFGDGKTLKVIEVIGGCPAVAAPPGSTPVDSTSPGAPQPPVNTVPPGGEFPPSR